MTVHCRRPHQSCFSAPGQLAPFFARWLKAQNRQRCESASNRDPVPAGHKSLMRGVIRCLAGVLIGAYQDPTPKGMSSAKTGHYLTLALGPDCMLNHTRTILLHTSWSSIVADDVLAWIGHELYTPLCVPAPPSGPGRRPMLSVLRLGPYCPCCAKACRPSLARQRSKAAVLARGPHVLVYTRVAEQCLAERE